MFGRGKMVADGRGTRWQWVGGARSGVVCWQSMAKAEQERNGKKSGEEWGTKKRRQTY